MTDPFTSPSADDTLPSPTRLTPPTPRPARKANSSLTWLLVIAAMVAIGGIAFAGGRLTAPASASNNRPGFPNGFPNGSFAPGPGGFVNRGLGGTTLRGEVTAVSSDSITIKLDNSSAVTIPLDTQTKYHQSTAGTASDVTVGSQVAVEPGRVDFQPGASFAPGASPGNLSFGPATDVTVVGQ